MCGIFFVGWKQKTTITGVGLALDFVQRWLQNPSWRFWTGNIVKIELIYIPSGKLTAIENGHLVREISYKKKVIFHSFSSSEGKLWIFPASHVSVLTFFDLGWEFWQSEAALLGKSQVSRSRRAESGLGWEKIQSTLR